MCSRDARGRLGKTWLWDRMEDDAVPETPAAHIDLIEHPFKRVRLCLDCSEEAQEDFDLNGW